MSDCCLLKANSAIFQLYHGESKLIFIETMMRSKVLDQHAELDFYSASSLKQQSMDRHVVQLGHIILIPSQPVFALSPKCCMLSGEATNINFIVFGLTRLRLQPKINRTFYGFLIWHCINIYNEERLLLQLYFLCLD